MSSPIIYMIRHGEKPPKVDGEDQNGLSEQGITRALNLPKVFGPGTEYNIGLILAQKPEAFEVNPYSTPQPSGQPGNGARPYYTIKPTADSYGYNEENKLFNAGIEKVDAEGVVAAVQAFKSNGGQGNILICWEHGELTDIAKAFGVPVKHPKLKYPDENFNIIWVLEGPDYNSINEPWTYYSCPGIPAGE